MPGMTSQIAEFKTAMSTAGTVISDFTAATKRTADDEESDLTKDSGWGRNRDSPALGRQDLASIKKIKGMTPFQSNISAFRTVQLVIDP